MELALGITAASLTGGGHLLHSAAHNTYTLTWRTCIHLHTQPFYLHVIVVLLLLLRRPLLCWWRRLIVVVVFHIRYIIRYESDQLWWSNQYIGVIWESLNAARRLSSGPERVFNGYYRNMVSERAGQRERALNTHTHTPMVTHRSLEHALAIYTHMHARLLAHVVLVCMQKIRCTGQVESMHRNGRCNGGHCQIIYIRLRIWKLAEGVWSLPGLPPIAKGIKYAPMQ